MKPSLDTRARVIASVWREDVQTVEQWVRLDEPIDARVHGHVVETLPCMYQIGTAPPVAETCVTERQGYPQGPF